MAKDEANKRGKRHKKQQQALEGDESSMAPEALPDRLRDQHRFVTCGPDLNVHVRGRHACFQLLAAHRMSAYSLRPENAPLLLGK